MQREVRYKRWILRNHGPKARKARQLKEADGQPPARITKAKQCAAVRYMFNPSGELLNRIRRTEALLDRNLSRKRQRPAEWAQRRLFRLQAQYDRAIPVNREDAELFLKSAAETIELVSHPSAADVARQLRLLGAGLRKEWKISVAKELPCLVRRLQLTLETSPEWPVRPVKSNEKYPPMPAMPPPDTSELRPDFENAEEIREWREATGMLRARLAVKYSIRRNQIAKQKALDAQKEWRDLHPDRVYRRQMRAWAALRRTRRLKTEEI